MEMEQQRGQQRQQQQQQGRPAAATATATAVGVVRDPRLRRARNNNVFRRATVRTYMRVLLGRASRYAVRTIHARERTRPRSLVAIDTPVAYVFPQYQKGPRATKLYLC